MSMQTLTVLQFIGVLAAYLGMTVLLPAFVFYRKVSEERFCVRFMIYLVIGNVYLFNLVLVLELLHISNRFTLFLGTVLPVIWAMARVHNVGIKDGVLEAAGAVNRFLKGTMGGRLLLSKTVRFCGKWIRTGFLRLFRSIRKNFFEWVLTLTCIGGVFWVYGCNLIWNMGYIASDMPVHTYWINALNRNDIFVAGVYPPGFHCTLYYLHKMFGFYTFVLMRVFSLVQTLMVHMVLLAFLKACCRAKYSPYIAMGMYLFANIWNKDTYSRFSSSLPQEFGMIFILPSIYFLYAFFEDRKREGKLKGFRIHSTRYLLFFALSFSATLAAHFYNTMIAGLFCVGVALGFLGLIFRREYFGRIMLAGILSVVLAVLPMAIAVATGTPLEGSLRWGMGIISNSSHSSDSAASNQQSAGSSGQAGMEALGGSGQSFVPEEQVQPPEPKIPFSVRLKAWIIEKKEKTFRFLQGLQSTIATYILNRVSLDTVGVVIIFTAFSGVLGIVFLFARKTRQYGSILLSVTFCILFLYAVMMAEWLGIPALMDHSRCSIYLAYILSAAVALSVDAWVSLLSGWFSTQSLSNMLSFGGVSLMIIVLALGRIYKEPLNLPGLECNEAITCLTNILRENPRFQFTVCTANDELRMVENDGYHYEIITLLRQMEGESVKDYFTIPTPKVYFFIEKVPIDYTETYEGSGSRVSVEGARKELPWGSGLGIYKGANRYVVMSKMYYWARAFQALYPNEMRVYYETDRFICYELTQNTYRLFDLSINYGFNGTAE